MNVIWAMFYSSVVSMQFHPGSAKGDHIPLSLVECAEVADAMYAEYVRRFPKG